MGPALRAGARRVAGLVASGASIDQLAVVRSAACWVWRRRALVSTARASTKGDQAVGGGRPSGDQNLAPLTCSAVPVRPPSLFLNYWLLVVLGHPFTVLSLRDEGPPLIMMTKVLLAALAVVASVASTATAAPSLIVPSSPSLSVASPLSTGVLPTSTRPAAQLVKLAFWELKSLATLDKPPCELLISDHVFASRRAGGKPRLRFVVRTDVTLRVGDNKKTFDLRSSCLRADEHAPFVCHETYVRDWPSFCRAHPESSLCRDHVAVNGRIAHTVRHALPHLPAVCAGLPHYPTETPPPMASPVPI